MDVRGRETEEERLTWWRAVNDRVGKVEPFTAELSG